MIGVDFEQAKKEIRKLVASFTEVKEADIKDDALFIEDLGIDSMMAIEIVAGIEKKFRVVVPEQQIPKMRTLNDVYGILKELSK